MLETIGKKRKNSYMRGDLTNSMLGYYRIPLRSKKYMKIFYHLIDKCVVNAWLLCKPVNTSEPYLLSMDLKRFFLKKKKKNFKKKSSAVAEENRTQGLIDNKKGSLFL